MNLYATYPDDFLLTSRPPIGRARTVPGPLKPHRPADHPVALAARSPGIAVIFDLLEQQCKTGILVAAYAAIARALKGWTDVTHTLSPGNRRQRF